jgi:membrane-associated phospholipid phosphatase
LAAASVGFERILADRHYASDVFVGAAVGALSGMLLPWMSFYAHPQQDDALMSWSLGPLPLPTGGVLSLRGIF